MHSDKKNLILFLSANPREYDELSLIKECNNIADKIKTAKQANQFDFRQRHEVSINMIQEFISEQTPQVVHFSGHGDKGFLLLEDENGLAEKAKRKAFVNMFGTLNGRTSIHERDKIRCVVLSACYSRGIAKAVARYVDCVVGMNNEIGDDAARVFAEAFYYHICSGESVADAVKLGRNKVELLDIPGQDIPKLEHRDEINPSRIFLTNIMQMSPQNGSLVGDPVKMLKNDQSARSKTAPNLSSLLAKVPSTISPREFWEEKDKGGLRELVQNELEKGTLTDHEKSELRTIVPLVQIKLGRLRELTRFYSRSNNKEIEDLMVELVSTYHNAVELITTERK